MELAVHAGQSQEYIRAVMCDEDKYANYPHIHGVWEKDEEGCKRVV